MEASCYICGVSGKHSYDCPKFSASVTTVETPSLPSPSAETKILRTFKDSNRKFWCLDIINPDDLIPSWATRGWRLDNHESIGRITSTREELATAWEEECCKYKKLPGWELCIEDIIPNIVYKTLRIWEKHKQLLIVFGRVINE